MLTSKSFPIPPPGSSVLITGADTGFGRLTSLEMGRLGFRVFAGVLNEASGESILSEFSKLNNKIPGGSITTLVLDVTNEDQLNLAFQRLTLELKDSGLQLLVNNCGIGLPFVFEIQPFRDIRNTLEINLLGHLNVTHKSLPLMRKANAPRIVNLTSLSGKLGTPLFVAYAASKFGMEGVSDCLRRELRHLNFSVSAIEPGFAKTPIVDKFAEYMKRLWDGTNNELKKCYDPIMKNYEKLNDRAITTSMDPNEVVKAIVHALTNPKPKPRYIVGFLAHLSIFLLWLFPDCVVDFMVCEIMLKL